MANSLISSDPSAARPRYGRRIIFTVLGAVLLIAAIAGLKVLFVVNKMASFKPPPPPTVTTQKVRAEDWRNQIDTVGSLRAVRGVDVTTEVAGLVRVGTLPVRARTSRPARCWSNSTPIPRWRSSSRCRPRPTWRATVLARDQEQLAARPSARPDRHRRGRPARTRRALVAQQRALVDKKTIRAPFAGRTRHHHGESRPVPESRRQDRHPADHRSDLRRLLPAAAAARAASPLGAGRDRRGRRLAGAQLRRQDHRHQSARSTPARATCRSRRRCATRSASCCRACSPTSVDCRWAPAALPDAAADRDHLQPLRRDRVRRPKPPSKDDKGEAHADRRSRCSSPPGATRGDQVADPQGRQGGRRRWSPAASSSSRTARRCVIDNSVQPAEQTRTRRRRNSRERQPPMKFTDLFIRRPVLAIVVSLLILVLGLRSLFSLPVNQYPQTAERGRHHQHRLLRRRRRRRWPASSPSRWRRRSRRRRASTTCPPPASPASRPSPRRCA